MNALDDRRQKRSQDPLIALHYQLAHARHDGDLEAIVLADTSGIVVAGAGSWAVCEELAAYAPILAQEGTGVWQEPGAGASASPRMASMKLDVEIHTVNIDGIDVFLCARGRWMGGVRGAMIERAARGVCRILQTSTTAS